MAFSRSKHWVAVALMTIGALLYITNLIYTNGFTKNYPTDAGSLYVFEMKQQDLDKNPGLRKTKMFLVFTIIALISLVPVIGLTASALCVKPPSEFFEKFYAKTYLVMFTLCTIFSVVCLGLGAMDTADYLQAAAASGSKRALSQSCPQYVLQIVRMSACFLSFVFVLSGSLIGFRQRKYVSEYFSNFVGKSYPAQHCAIV